MPEHLSVNALSLALGADRRTVARWLDIGNVQPVARGANGPLFRLRDAVRVLVDAGLLSNEKRQLGYFRAQAAAAGELAQRISRALGKARAEDQLRTVLHIIADETFHYVAEVE